jgi:hypothetical protein
VPIDWQARFAEPLSKNGACGVFVVFGDFPETEGLWRARRADRSVGLPTPHRDADTDAASPVDEQNEADASNETG